MKTKHAELNYFILFVFSLNLTVGYAQSTWKIDSQSFDRKWIKKGITEMTCYSRSGNQLVPFGVFDINVTEKNDRLSIVTRLKMIHTDQTWTDTSISDGNTLQPIYRSSYTPDRRMVLQFGKEVKGYYYDRKLNRETSVKEPITAAMLESYTYPYLLAALPLSSGYKAELLVYDYKTGQQTNVNKVVIEEVRSSSYASEFSGEHAVWCATVNEPATNDQYTYYIDKETRRLWKIELRSKNQYVVMLNKEAEESTITARFDKEQAMAMIQSGKSVIEGQAFARDNENEGILGGKAIFNINKKQYAAKGVAVLLIPYTAYYKEWVTRNESLRKRGKSIPLSKEAAACIKVATVYDDKGSFEFVNLQAGEYLLYTEFGYIHTSNRTEVVGYTDTYINGMFQGTSANTETYKVQGGASANIKKIITIKKDGEKVTVKLKKTL
jgi:hypothetical protein